MGRRGAEPLAAGQTEDEAGSQQPAARNDERKLNGTGKQGPHPPLQASIGRHRVAERSLLRVTPDRPRTTLGDQLLIRKMKRWVASSPRLALVMGFSDSTVEISVELFLMHAIYILAQLKATDKRGLLGVATEVEGLVFSAFRTCI